MPDIPGNSSTTASIQIGEEFIGSFEDFGDVDWIRIELVAGVTYGFNLGAAPSSSVTFLDTLLDLYDESGSLVASNDDRGVLIIFNPTMGLNHDGYSYLQYTPTTSGTYYLAAGTFEPLYTGDYLLSAYAGDLPATADTPADLPLGAAVTGQIDAAGDRDGYRIATVPGQYYTVTLSGSGFVFDQFLQLPDLIVTDADGATIAHHTNPAEESTLQLTFLATSEVSVLNIGASLSAPDSVGQYTVRVNDGSPLDALEENIRAQPSHIDVYFVGEAQVTVGSFVFAATEWSADEIAAAMAAYEAYSQVANITFSVVDDPAQAEFFMTRADDPEFGVTGRAFPFRGTGTVTIDGVAYTAEGLANFDYTGPFWGLGHQPGTFGFSNFLHEIGHLLGLAHPFETTFSSAVLPGVTFPIGDFWYAFDYGDFSLDQGVFSVMSYVSGFRESHGEFFVPTFGEPGTPMALDVAQVQKVHGANTSTNPGDDTYVLPDVNDLGTFYASIWDTGGTDTIAVAATNTAGATVDLRAASIAFDSIGGGAVSAAPGVHGGFTIAAGVVIENATGAAGNDRLVGNEAANVLLGNGGADRMGGGAGDDELHGGDGDDSLFGDVLPGEPTGIGFGDGQVVKAAGAGNNWFDVAIDLTNEFSLAADPDIANATTTPHVTVTGTGDGNFDMYSLTLTAGTTITLDIDHTTGGIDSYVELYELQDGYFEVYGFDQAFLGAQDDSPINDGAGGSSTSLDAFGTFVARTTGTYFIVVEDAFNLFVFDGQNYELNISIAATTEAVGSGAGDDLIDGGAGADTMTGGGGNDRYIVDNAGDVAIETSGGGDADEVSASVTYSAIGQHIERIVLTGGDAINATGQELDNVITGNAAANRLDGAGGDDWLDGGLGADTMLGGAGNDVFVVDNAYDQVVEAPGGGLDEVRSSVTYALAHDVENLILTGSAGINGTGQSLDNRIVGNAGSNTLYGAGGNDWLDGGPGADTMFGGSGDDVFIVDNALDRVIEVLGGGRDEVRSSVSFDLGVILEHIEILSLTGAAAINATGNWLDNTITGNTGANQISGGLGDDRLDGAGGADRLTGGLGRDVFVFSSALGLGNVDTVQDFRTAQDRIDLDDAVFTGLAVGSLSAAAFKDLGRRGAVVDASDRILYNSDNGDLLFDADGSASGFGAIKFANLGSHTPLAASDFLVI